MGQAATIRVGYFYGARDPEGMKRAGWAAIAIGTGFMGITALAMIIAPRYLLAIYVDPWDPANAVLIGYALTGGLASMSIKAAIQNETARTKASTRPYFYFFFDESNASDGRATGTWLAGTAATVSTPSEFTLIRLIRKDGRREARVGSMNIAGAKTGVMDKDRIEFDYKMVRPGVFKAKAANELEPGEYGFIYAIAGAGTGGAMTARIFDFTVE